MRIGVISDTHGSLTAFNKVLNYLEDIDLLIHAGDLLYHGPRNPLPEGYDPGKLAERLTGLNIPLVLVRGNVDAEVDDWVLPYPLPSYALVQDGSRRIVVYHGFQHSSEEEMVTFGQRFGARILIYGHIHQPVLKEVDGVILLNPGSTALPKQEPKEPTFAIIDEFQVQVKSLVNGQVLLEKKI
ncbi:YfcE family phosphodiesterase [Anoxybacter fermentans]|uniref:Phosphoesterase n=1 Tax=Anoxybacter fermentans TaxID=1323375 RepID=A0A3Q9HNR8_9FIRM|nr:phosphodiesterase [Anoxybacter fermentans]AZR72210.1 YfcE family phosphodiesterase [Anoxybacter fermentans]